METDGLSKSEQIVARTAAKSQTIDAFAAVLFEHREKIQLRDSRATATPFILGH